MKKNIVVLFSVIILSLIFAVAVNAQNNNSSNSTQKKDKKLKIRNKPLPTSTGCGNQSSGRAIVKVTFDKLGWITDAELITSSGCESFDKSSVYMARNIIFEPAIKDGEAITVIKNVMYDFNRY